MCVFLGGGSEGAADEQREEQQTEPKFSFRPQGKDKYNAIMLSNISQYDMNSLNILSVCPFILSCLEADKTYPQPAC